MLRSPFSRSSPAHFNQVITNYLSSHGAILMMLINIEPVDGKDVRKVASSKIDGVITDIYILDFS